MKYLVIRCVRDRDWRCWVGIVLGLAFIVQAASGYYDLVVVGTRGLKGITRFLLGSTAERITRHAPVPVLIVKGARDAMGRVLICTAGNEPALAAVECGGRVAHLIGAEVTVLHVMSQIAVRPVLPLDVLEDLEAPASVLMEHHTPEGLCLEDALAVLARLEVPARPMVRHGPVFEEILDEAGKERMTSRSSALIRPEA